ncbi:ABC transporter substrate-binding protein [Bradyrhizobium sp. CCBAU 53338]|uniref:ABC transporter substrate-binding protein n=1 Tax=Bradyrhizobium sp. CCBAU 53338 TaxID=1325111 RepID=UPI00188A56A5|nr:ABC transporter substrate-binding protein [Bradyrhizobium sp. CCBAU 53338]QOZ51511.1 branched-chain amino acid ABC transporter substrate-binding protein [Bradyrhizobium sp. CCBAU 53338]
MTGRPLLLATMSLALSVGVASAQKKYDAGANDTEIKIGNMMPYSGPASAYANIGKATAAYFSMINEAGGLNGRKLNFISYDDGYSPPKAVEQVRRLVESDEVLFMLSPMGTPSNAAIQKYLNAKKIPHLFPASNASRWSDPKNFPWTMASAGVGYVSEAYIYARYLLKTRPDEKIAVLYQNDDFGKELLKGLKEGLGSNVSMIVAEVSYEVTQPTIDSQIPLLKSSGATTLFSFAIPKFAAQSIKRAAQIGWSPLHFIPGVSANLNATIVPAGLDSAQGIISGTSLKDPSDPAWANDPGMTAYLSFLSRWMPDANKADQNYQFGYNVGQLMSQVLKQCGDDLTRENVMRQAANLKNVQLDTSIPGITISTSPTNYSPVNSLQLIRFQGSGWERFGDILTDDRVH